MTDQRPVRQNIKTIDSTDVMGKGSWVKLRSMSVAEHTLYQSLIRGSQQLAKSPETTVDDLMKNEARLREVLVGCVVEWNWVDDAGADLPHPHKNPEVIELLTNDEVSFIMESLLAGGQAAKKKQRTSK